MSKMIYYIGVFFIYCYHACYLDFWKGVFFGLCHRKHKIYIATCPDGTKSAVCETCHKEQRFKQKC